MTVFESPEEAWITGWRDCFFGYDPRIVSEPYGHHYEHGYIRGYDDRKNGGPPPPHLKHPNPPKVDDMVV